MLINEDKKIEDLIKEAYNEKIWLPEFQRPFVWDNNQIRLLVDSLFHNYTISSILTWKGGDELARRRVGGKVEDIKIPNDEKKEIVYLLDGQQRTTALTYAFTEKEMFKSNRKTPSKPISLYWDSEYMDDEVEKRWVFDDEIIYIDNSEDTFKIADLEKTNELITKFGTRFVRLKDLMLDNKELENRLKLEDNELKYKFMYEYNQKIYDLRAKILNRKVVDIEQKGDLVTVLEVFERINTKNTKLSIFDIMVAKTYRKYDEGYFDLRSFIKIISSANKSVEANYFKNITKIDDFQEQKIFDESTLLYLIMVAMEKGFRANKVLEIKTDDFMQKIKDLHFILNRLSEIMEKDFYIEVEEQKKYQPIAKFIVAFLTNYSKKENEPAYKSFLQKWYWNTIIYNRYPGAQNERIEKDFKRLNENIPDFNKVLEIMKSDNSRSFEYIDNGGIQNLFNCYYNKKNDQIYKMMLVLLKSKEPKDFYTGDIPTKSATKKLLVEEHHIFPLNSEIGKQVSNSYKSRNDNIINNIANIVLITKETNNKRISNKNPSIYIKEFLQAKQDEGKEEEFYDYLATHFISKEMVEFLLKDDFESFIVSRTKLIYDYIKELTK
jgi:hypothetical protein